MVPADSLYDGPLARLNPALTAFGVVVGGFPAYMAIGSVAFLAILVLQGVSPMEAAAGGGEQLFENVAALLTGNAIGMVVGLGGLAILVARLQSTRPWLLLRVRMPNLKDVSLALLGLLAILPAIFWIGELNEAIPIPEFTRMMEEEQLLLLEKLLSGEGSLVLNLVLVALTPALFEEVFFRGLVQRNLERAWGGTAGIAATGIIFGLFHLRFTQALPLILLGIYLAYLTWQTGSLWVPVIVHFANNALALVFGEAGGGTELDALGASVFPWYLAILGIPIFLLIIMALQRRGSS